LGQGPLALPKSDHPQWLMEVTDWWIVTQKLDDFENAIKIKNGRGRHPA
jgi:hypothetical protein